MKALLLIGSGRRDSHTKALGQAIESSLKKHDVQTVCFELAKQELPFADPTFHKHPEQNPDPKVQTFVRYANDTDLFVFLSPIYHNSYSGILKNALDHLAIVQCSGKVVGLASHGGNRTTQAVDHLRIVTRGLNALTIPTQVCTQDSDYTPHEQGFSVTDPGILERIERFTQELVTIGSALCQR